MDARPRDARPRPFDPRDALDEAIQAKTTAKTRGLAKVANVSLPTWIGPFGA